MAVSLVAGGVRPLTPDSSTSLEELTSGIRFYLREMGQNVIEIGKRLILAKALVQHGEWQNWLEDNFNLSLRTARQFMQIAERFGEKSDSQEWQTSAVLNQSQMVEMLSLPEGEEEKFIEEQAAAGRVVAEMSVKTLRIAIQQYKAKLASANVGVESSVTVDQASVSPEKVEEPVQFKDFSSVETVEEVAAVEGSADTGVVSDLVSVLADGGDDQRVGQNLLEQFFDMMKALALGGNLQRLVEQSAENNSQALEDELRQFAALYGDIQSCLSQWKRGKGARVESAADEMFVWENVEPVEENVVANTDVKVPIVEDTAVVDKGGDNENSLESFVGKICDKKSDDVDDSDRHSIISALYQIALTDDENFSRTEFIGELMEGKGFEVVHQMSTKELYTVLYLVALKFHIYT